MIQVFEYKWSIRPQEVVATEVSYNKHFFLSVPLIDYISNKA